MQSAYSIERGSLNLGKLPAEALDAWPIISSIRRLQCTSAHLTVNLRVDKEKRWFCRPGVYVLDCEHDSNTTLLCLFH